MMSSPTFTSTDISTYYKANYPGEPDDKGEWLAAAYAARFEDLRAMVAPLRMCVDDAGWSRAVARQRQVTIPGKTPSLAAICKLASAIATSDRHFGAATAQELRGRQDLGSMQRMARQAQVVIDHRPNDVAYWRQRIAAKLGWGADTGGGAGRGVGASAGGGGHSGPGPEQEDTEEEHVVEAVQGKRTTAGGDLEYWVKWSGSTECSWEPLTNLQGSMTLVGEYEVQLDGRRIGDRRPEARAGPETTQLMSDFSRALAALMEGQSTTQQQLQLLAEERTDKKEKTKVDDRCAWDRPVLKGDERRQKVGKRRFDQERQIDRMRKLCEMDASKPFATQYNAEMSKAMKLEAKLLEAEYAREEAAKKDNQVEQLRAEARHEVLHDQLVVVNDRVAFLGGCSDMTSDKPAEWHVAQVMVEDMDEEAEETVRNAEFKKRKTKAQEKMRKDAEVAQGVFIQQHLHGVGGAYSRGGRGPVYQQPQQQPQLGGYQQGYQHQGQAGGYSQPPMPPGPPPPMPPGPPPMPPVVPVGGKGGKGGERFRTRFNTAEAALGDKCPAQLQGHMVPVGMRFFTPGKTLDAAPRVRTTPFPHACKLCEKVGHEAFECTEQFQFQGRPACNYRQLFQMGLLDANGMLR